MKQEDQYRNIFQPPYILFEQFLKCCQVNYNLEGFTKTQILNFYVRKLVEEACEVLSAFNRTDKKAYPKEDPVKVKKQIEEDIDKKIKKIIIPEQKLERRIIDLEKKEL